MMGAPGLRLATQVAVLSANYIAGRLAPHFPVLYAGRGGLVAHECVIDLRKLPGGITVDDVAKRLIDYGFHAPTMSFPVAGTFMIEPTESESLAEIDQFCDAMISIKAEIDKIASGEADAADNPLKNAPHTAEMLIIGEWKHAYPPADGGYPAAGRGDARSTGRRSAVSTRPTVTATWSAPARRRKPSSSGTRSGRGSRRYTGGNRGHCAVNPAGGLGTAAEEGGPPRRPGSPRPPEAGPGEMAVPHSWTAMGRSPRSARWRGRSITTTLSCSSASVRATTAITVTSPRFTGRCGIPGGMYMKSPALTTVLLASPAPCQTSFSPLTV